MTIKINTTGNKRDLLIKYYKIINSFAKFKLTDKELLVVVEYALEMNKLNKSPLSEEDKIKAILTKKIKRNISYNIETSYQNLHNMMTSMRKKGFVGDRWFKPNVIVIIPENEELELQIKFNTNE